jgi:hypothetical protein
VLQVHRKQYLIDRYGKDYKSLAGSETSRMHGNFLRGNREALYLALYCMKVRAENPKGIKQ